MRASLGSGPDGSVPKLDRVRAVTRDDRLERYAELAVRVGADLAPGQTLDVYCNVEHHPLARAIARAAYAAGARYVDVLYVDQHVRRAMIERGDEEILT